MCYDMRPATCDMHEILCNDSTFPFPSKIGTLTHFRKWDWKKQTWEICHYIDSLDTTIPLGFEQVCGLNLEKVGEKIVQSPIEVVVY